MTKKLREQFDAVGHITNHFGRIIKCEKKSPFVAYAVQSTAVDVVCQGFTHLLDELESDKIEMTSLYLIHDALMVDLPPESAQHLEGRIKDGIFIPTLNCKMPLKLKTIDA
jgi:DNA polymerase I-like protein with 3'-5' exonuclease and polymerase domains